MDMCKCECEAGEEHVDSFPGLPSILIAFTDLHAHLCYFKRCEKRRLFFKLLSITGSCCDSQYSTAHNVIQRSASYRIMSTRTQNTSWVKQSDVCFSL